MIVGLNLTLISAQEYDMYNPEVQDPNRFQSTVPEPQIPEEEMQNAVVSILTACGADASQAVLSVEMQQACYNNLLSGFYKLDTEETIKTLREEFPDQNSPFVLRNIVDSTRTTQFIPEVLPIFEKHCVSGEYDGCPQGLDTPLDQAAWTHFSGYYLMMAEKKFQEIFVNYPDSLELKSWADLGMDENVVTSIAKLSGVEEATLGITLTESPTLEEFMIFKTKYAVLYPGDTELKIADLSNINSVWDCPLFFFGSILERPYDWLQEDLVTDSLKSISTKISHYYDAATEEYTTWMAEQEKQSGEPQEEGVDIEESEPVEGAEAVDNIVL